jgi:hypothetical protein
MSDENKKSNENKGRGLIFGSFSFEDRWEELRKKHEEERLAKEPPIIKELIKDSFFEKGWWSIDNNEDRDRVRQLIVEKQLSRQAMDDAINKIRVITGEAKEKLEDWFYHDYLVRLPLIFRLLELEKTNTDMLNYILFASCSPTRKAYDGLRHLDDLLRLQYIPLEDIVKFHKEMNAGAKDNFNEEFDFDDLGGMLMYRISLLNPYRGRTFKDDMRDLTEKEKKSLSSLIMNIAVELSKKGADDLQISQLLNSLGRTVEQHVKSGKELTNENLGEMYNVLLAEPAVKAFVADLGKYRELGVKYDKDGEKIWEYMKKIPSVQELSTKQDFESKHTLLELERLYRRACRKNEITYLEFIEVMNVLKRLGGQSIDFNDLKWSHNSSDFLKEFHRLKRLIRDTKNESTLRDYIQKKHDFSWLVKNLKQVEQMLSLGIQRGTALRMDSRSYHGVEDAPTYLRKLDGLREIVGDQKHQRLVSAVQMLLDSHANLPLVGLTLAYMNMGYTRKLDLDISDSVEGSIRTIFTTVLGDINQLLKRRAAGEDVEMFREESPVKNPQRLFEESEKDPREFLLYILNVPVRDAITRYIEETTRRMQRRGKHHEIEDGEPWVVGEPEKYTEGRKISFYGIDLERLEKIISEYTLKNSATPYEVTVEKRPIKPSDIVTASNIVSSVIPNLLNRLPQFYRNRMTLGQVLAYCEKELKQQSKLDNIMGITIKKGGMEQTVGEYVKYTIETRYKQLSGNR